MMMMMMMWVNHFTQYSCSIILNSLAELSSWNNFFFEVVRFSPAHDRVVGRSSFCLQTSISFVHLFQGWVGMACFSVNERVLLFEGDIFWWMNHAPPQKKSPKNQKRSQCFVRQGCCWNQLKVVCFFSFIIAVLLEISNFPSFKGGVSYILRFCRWGLNQPPNPPSPSESESGRFRGVLVPTTSGETLIDFMVNGESILGSPCLGVGGGWLGDSWGWYIGVSYRELQFVVCSVVWMDFVYFFGVNCCFLFWFCFFWKFESHCWSWFFFCVFFVKHACNTKAFERPTVTVLDDNPAWWP